MKNRQNPLALRLRRYLLLPFLCLATGFMPLSANADVGTAFPSDFPVILDSSSGQPVIGFGAAGKVTRTPVIFLHGNNDTPYPTSCNPYGKMQAFAEFFHQAGYAESELWGLGYQGDQCDLIAQPSNRSGAAHTVAANVPDLRRFVKAVLAYTGARQVDVVGHSLGAVLVREWLRQDNAWHLVRRVVSVDGPHHGIISCSPNPLNYWQQAGLGGFTPDSAVCQEFGADDTPLLARLNAKRNTPGPTRFMAIRNADTSFVYFAQQDGLIAPVPAEDRNGRPHDFTFSTQLSDAVNVDVFNQGQYDPILGTTHLGIVNSPQVWNLTLNFLLPK
jgi:pimeloyl-ACP methyl ester carboxylesterase